MNKLEVLGIAHAAIPNPLPNCKINTFTTIWLERSVAFKLYFQQAVLPADYPDKCLFGSESFCLLKVKIQSQRMKVW